MTTPRTPEELDSIRRAARLTIKETARRTGNAESHIRAVLAGNSGVSGHVLKSLDHVIVSDALRQKRHLDHVVDQFVGGAA